MLPAAHRDVTQPCSAAKGNFSSISLWPGFKLPCKPLRTRSCATCHSAAPDMDSPGCTSRRAEQAQGSRFVVGLKSSQILLCHKPFQLRKHAIMPLITFFFDERSRLFFLLLFYFKCMLYRVRRTFISILCIPWHRPCLRPTAGSGPCRGTCSSSALAIRGFRCQQLAEWPGFGFCGLTPVLSPPALPAPKQEGKRPLALRGLEWKSLAAETLSQCCQVQASAEQEIYILLITMVISHKHKFKE